MKNMKEIQPDTGNTCTAVALNVTHTFNPGVSPSFRTLCRVTADVRRTPASMMRRVYIPLSSMDRTVPGREFRAEEENGSREIMRSSGRIPARTVPEISETAYTLTPSRRISAEPSDRGTDIPEKRFSIPVNPAIKSDAGRRRIASGVPSWAILPFRRTSTRSARAYMSSK